MITTSCSLPIQYTLGTPHFRDLKTRSLRGLFRFPTKPIALEVDEHANYIQSHAIVSGRMSVRNTETIQPHLHVHSQRFPDMAEVIHVHPLLTRYGRFRRRKQALQGIGQGANLLCQDSDGVARHSHNQLAWTISPPSGKPRTCRASLRVICLGFRRTFVRDSQHVWLVV